MTRPARMGLLPLYLEFYDERLPDLRPPQEAFLARVVARLREWGVDIEPAAVCRTDAEVREALAGWRDAGLDGLITLHLAYAPSGEAIGGLLGCDLPLIMLDTTPDADFGRGVEPLRLLYNHGIHGVQDLASVLRREGRPYWVVAGHLDRPGTRERLMAAVSAARAARTLRTARVLRIGAAFKGMLYFHAETDVLRERLGIRVVQIAPAELKDDVEAVSEAEVDAEIAADVARYEVDLPEAVHRRSVRLGLGMRRMMEREGHGAFSMNFDAFDSPEEPICTIPFLECCKAMTRGIGYAGEGDVLTAAFIGALLAIEEKSSFTEIFCPDWAGNSIFLSHMGEFNPALAAGRARIYEKANPFSNSLSAAAVACAPRPGPATFVNLAPGAGGTFRMIAAPVEVLEDGTHTEMREWIRGWMRPGVPVEEFLERFSMSGGTHHSGLMAGDHLGALRIFALMAGIEYEELR